MATVLPEKILRLLSPEDRKSLGAAGMTAEEAMLKAEVKNERALQVLIINLLRLKGIEPLWHRTDKRSAATVGWPDISFAISVASITKEVPLGKNGKQGVAIVSAKDFELVSQFRWTRFSNGNSDYAFSTVRPRILMHRLIMSRVPNPEGKADIDHINRNGLDNSRGNLRWATRSENCMNRVSDGGTSRFKGVSWSEQRQKWTVNIKINKKNYGLGRFDSEIDAAKAYDKAANEAYGPFAALNFPSDFVGIRHVSTIACAWEVKHGTGELSKEQLQMSIRLQSAPNHWRWREIRSVDQAIAELREMGIE